MKERHSVHVRGSDFWRRTLILAAVLSLTIHVATRYGMVTPQQAQGTKSATSQSLDAKRQHLLNDGFHWSAPAAKFVLLEPPRLSAAVLPFVAFVTELRSEECIYVRPPPHC
jgi:hypothetical protein